MKMCLQFWRSLGKPQKQRFLTWRRGYHGDTFHPMSVCDPDGGMHSLWSGVLPNQVFAASPPGGFSDEASTEYLDHLADLVSFHAGELAAIIIEPVVQGAGGMRFHNPRYVEFLRDLATQHDVLFIADEIATGFGRTGELFAVDHVGVTPDVMCLGKAMTGGYMSMAATLCNSRVAEGIASGEVPVLAHGPTFMGNPLAAAVSRASIDLLLSSGWRNEVRRINTALHDGLRDAKNVNGVKDVRVLGAIGVIQLDHEVDIESATRAACAEGVWLRPFRDLVYVMPPYIMDNDDLHRVTQAMCAAAEAG
jgi:adenosylmethionine---8-amino-7-oxononanoate aminotransferase